MLVKTVRRVAPLRIAWIWLIAETRIRMSPEGSRRKNGILNESNRSQTAVCSV